MSGIGHGIDPRREREQEREAYGELMTNRQVAQAFDYLMEHPKILDTLPIYELRLMYHQYLNGFIPEGQISQLFRKLEERVKSTDI